MVYAYSFLRLNKLPFKIVDNPFICVEKNGSHLMKYAYDEDLKLANNNK